MTIIVVVFSVFVFLSFLSTVVILSALVRSSQNVRWDEGTKRWASHAGEPESVMIGELWRETSSIT
jgi:hypothetical protein